MRRPLVLWVLATFGAVAPTAASDWSGAYGGFQFGALDGEAAAPGGGSASGGIAGFHAGYGVDLGRFVVGGEVDFDLGEISLGDVTLDSVARLKLRAGGSLGQSFIYGTAGLARADTSVGVGSGGFAGVGAGWRLGARTTIGGEVLYQQFDDIDGSGVDIEGTTATARVTFSF
jgi:outer membrane immunogenic protein